MVLLAPRTESERIEHMVSRRTLVSSQTVAKVGRLDGRSRIVAVRTEQGWRRSGRMRWTRSTVELLRGEIREVLLSRRLRHARVALAWVPKAAR